MASGPGRDVPDHRGRTGLDRTGLDLDGMIRDGRIRDAKSIMLLQWAVLDGPFRAK